MPIPFEPTDIADLQEGVYPVPFLNTRIWPILRALLPSSAQKALLESGGTGGGTGAVVTTKTISAATETWTDTGIVLNGLDALTIEAFGDVRHNPNVPLSPIQSDGVLRLHAVIVADGVTPVADMVGQFDYRLSAKLSRQSGRVWLRIRDTPEGYFDNSGSVTATLSYYADAATALAPATVAVDLSAEIAARQAGDAALQTAIDANKPAMVKIASLAVAAGQSANVLSLNFTMPANSKHLKIIARIKLDDDSDVAYGDGYMYMSINADRGQNYRHPGYTAMDVSAATPLTSTKNKAKNDAFIECLINNAGMQSELLKIATVNSFTNLGEGYGRKFTYTQTAPTPITSIEIFSGENVRQISPNSSVDVYAIF